jgi:hypothetical protein
LDLAFRLMLPELGDKAIFATFFDPGSASFKEVLTTTWKELCDQHWLEEREVDGHPQYRMTGSGWMEALWRTGAGEKSELKERSGKLAAVLKDRVKGREKDVVIELTKLANEGGLSPGWVFNAIESNLIETLLRRRGVQWEDRVALVRIPSNFGLALIDHSADLRAQLEEVRGELEHTKEQLGEYTCSFCQAPIVFQGSYPLSDQVDGYAIEYACGRRDDDGPRPCPSDPTFPKLDDYELVFREQPSEPTWKWYCLAVGKTAKARQVDLGQGMGQTKEEAETKIRERYEHQAKPHR